MSKSPRSIAGKIIVRPVDNGWDAFEAPGVQPFFWERALAIAYARQRLCAPVEVWDAQGRVVEFYPVEAQTPTR